MDTYVELLIKRKTSIVMKILKVVLIITAAFSLFWGLMGLVFCFIPALLFGGLGYLAHMNDDIEFEYLYVDRELSIDKIMAKSKRKKVETLELERMEIFAPINSYRLAEYKNKNYKTADYSCKEEAQPDTRYVMYYNGEKKIILEANKEIITAIKNIAPRKVFTD